MYRSIPYLTVSSPQGIQEFILAEGTAWTIGRSKENNIMLLDESASRKHAMVQIMAAGEFYLIDLGSRNGSFVEGRRVTVPVPLQDGERIVLGKTEIQFHCAPHTPEELADPSEDLSNTVILQSNRRLITVLVMDIRDFTKLTRQLDERVLSEVIGTWFRRAGEIIRQYDSRVDKYIGDALMAVWIHGVPDSNGVPVGEMTKVLKALHELYQMSNELNKHYALPFPLKVGVGINTGHAMVGHMGDRDRADYTALGDTVNAAFRLESATKELGMDLVLGESTFHCLPPSRHTPFRSYKVHLKGYEHPVTCYGGMVKDVTQFIKGI